jgi:hypothetical protein
MGELAWRQQNQPRLHRRLTLRSPSGTLGMGVATWVTMSSSYYPSRGYPESSLRAGTSTSARYPDCYASLEWYASYATDQAERAVEGIG